MRYPVVSVAMTLVGAIASGLGCGSESTPADSRAFDSGAGTGGEPAGRGGTGGSAGASRDARADGPAGSGGTSEDARGDVPPDRSGDVAGQCDVPAPCPFGMGGRRDFGCVDAQSGEREACDADSITVDFGERCFVSCKGESTAPTPDPACPPCAPLCTMVFSGYFVVGEAGICSGQGFICAPPGHGAGCYPPDP